MTDAPVNNDPLRAEVALHIRRLDERHDSDWAAHQAVHQRELVAVEKVAASIEKRFDDANEWRGTISDRDQRLASQEALEAIKKELTDFKHDTRLRMENMGDLIRKEVRPVQDARVGQVALVAALIIGVSVISAVIAVANYLSSH
jgi:hypothetical protein